MLNPRLDHFHSKKNDPHSFMYHQVILTSIQQECALIKNHLEFGLVWSYNFNAQFSHSHWKP